MDLPKTDLDADPVLDQQINQLRAKISRIEIENRDLKDKIEVTNEGISSYISEMSTMLDSEESGQNFGMERRSNVGQNQIADGLVQDSDNMGALAIDPHSLENDEHINFDDH